MCVKQVVCALAFEKFAVVQRAGDQFELDNQVGRLVFGLLVALAFVSQNLRSKHARLDDHLDLSLFLTSSPAV